MFAAQSSATLAGRLATPDGIVDGFFSWDDTVITTSGTGHGDRHRPVYELPEGYLILPGLIDTHCHGAGGFDFTSGTSEDITAAAEYLHKSGSTTVLASTCALPLDDLITTFGRLAVAVGHGLIAGIHAEGPFLSPARSGAHNPAFLREPTENDIKALVTAARGSLTSMTYAPELPGSKHLVQQLITHGIIPSIGHTDCSYEEMVVAVHQLHEAISSAGSSGSSSRPTVTHLFNAMRPMHHRNPGPVPFLLQLARAGEIAVELIADDVHLHPAVVTAVFDLVGHQNVCLVSDSTSAAGCTSGLYYLGRSEIMVNQGAATLTHSGALAGGAGSLLDVVRATVKAGVSIHCAVQSASQVPAVLLGIDDEVGSLTPGLRADALVVSSTLGLRGVLRNGRWIRSMQ